MTVYEFLFASVNREKQSEAAEAAGERVEMGGAGKILSTKCYSL